MKKHVLLVTLLLVAGCTSQISKEDLARRIADAGKGITSYQANGTVSTTLDLATGDAKQSVSSETLSGSRVDVANKRLMLSTRAGTGAEETSYLINDTLYLLSDGQWVKTQAAPGLWNEQSQYATLLALLNASVVELKGEEQLDGKAHYVIRIVPDARQLLDSSLFSEKPKLPEGMKLEDILKEFTITVWVQKDTFYISKLTSTVRIQAEEPKQHVSVKLTMRTALSIHDHNRPAAIGLPAEANNAVDISMLGGNGGNKTSVRIAALPEKTMVRLADDFSAVKRASQNISSGIDALAAQAGTKRTDALAARAAALRKSGTSIASLVAAVDRDLAARDERLDEDSLALREEINAALVLASHAVNEAQDDDDLLAAALAVKKNAEQVREAHAAYIRDFKQLAHVNFDDLDGDGILNRKDDDMDGDGVPNAQDDDDDNDGVPDAGDFDQASYDGNLEKMHGIDGADLIAQGSAGYVSVVYDEDASAPHQEYARIFRESQLFESMAAGLNGWITLPNDIPVVFGDCGQENAFYSPQQHLMVMCYELIDAFARVYQPYVTTDEELGRRMIDATSFVFYHELGHALIDQLSLPITGREEDVADQISTWFLLAQGEDGERAAIEGANAFLLLEQEGGGDLAYWDTHALGTQRFYNILCWVYGKDPVKYAHLVEDGTLPENRAAMCEHEYAQLSNSLGYLMAPYIKDTAGTG